TPPPHSPSRPAPPTAPRPAPAAPRRNAAAGTPDPPHARRPPPTEPPAKRPSAKVADWLENNATRQPDNERSAQQIRQLHRNCLSRSEWRHQHALVFKDRPDYRFVLGEKGEVLDIVAEPRRIANRIVEESMIAANLCAARVLR
ncbi:RNB domain-containing ribonuclease, partial [Salmonella enterica]|uniref:RNB domain-containing ribonuclease n=1 Tax=Salmonella enterica TaxID=28901 RepID=UPI002892D69D